MGEISEALRRARLSQTGSPGGASEREVSAAAPVTSSILSVSERIVIGNGEKGPAQLMISDPGSPQAESYRHAAVRLARAARERKARSIVVTSAVASEGKTTTCCNLAVALASIAGGKRVLLLDTDLRRPSVARALGISTSLGLEDVVLGGIEPAKACVGTQFPELDVLLAKPSNAPLTVVSSPAMSSLLGRLARSYDLIVVDSPPVLAVPDVSLMLQSADAAVLVARSGVTRKRALEAATEAIGQDKLLGLFLNGARPLWRQDYSYGYYAHNAGSADGV